MVGTVEGKLEGKLVCMVVGSKLAVDSKQVLDSKLVCMVVGSKDRGRSSSLST